jgi:Kef-type K+ transport system membrane component KefB
VLIGPSLLGWIPRDAIRPDGVISSLGALGVMFLLFRVGLDVKSSRLWKIGRMAAMVAAAGVTFSFLLVWGALGLCGIHSTEALFVAAALAATSVGITAQVLAARGLLSQRASEIILAAAVLDDICGLLLLSIVSSGAAGAFNLNRTVLTIVLSIAFVAIVARWGSPAMHRLIPRAGGLRLAEAEFALSVCLLFALALFSTYTGVAAIVGAFLAGMALGESVGQRVRTLVHGATELLVPFFLVGIGLSVDAAALRTAPMILLAVLLFAAAVLAKVGGCGLASLGMGRTEALRIGVGMIPRGEVTMVVAQLGLTMGVITQNVFGVVVLVAVATTLVAPPLIKAAFGEHVATASVKLG